MPRINTSLIAAQVINVKLSWNLQACSHFIGQAMCLDPHAVFTDTAIPASGVTFPDPASFSSFNPLPKPTFERKAGFINRHVGSLKSKNRLSCRAAVHSICFYVG